MGILKAIGLSVSSVLKDQYKEFFYCDAFDENVLVKRGYRKASQRSQNHGDSDVITKGSLVIVGAGEGAAIVSQGKVTAYVTEPGEYVYNDSEELSVFSDGIKIGTKASLKEVGKRIAYGGETPMVQRIYYFNTKEIIGTRYETGYMPVRIVDQKIGLDIDVSVKCRGVFSYKLVDLALFYKNVCGNVSSCYLVSDIESQLNAELLTAFPPAMKKVSMDPEGFRAYELVEETEEIVQVLNEELSEKWRNLRGIELVSIGIEDFEISSQDMKMISRLQATAVLQDIDMARAALVSGMSDAMVQAARNQNHVSAILGVNLLNQLSEIPDFKLDRAIQHTYQCDQCGFVVPDGEKKPKFCPQCGDPMNAKDIKL